MKKQKYKEDYKRERIILLVLFAILFLLIGFLIGCISYYTLCCYFTSQPSPPAQRVNETTTSLTNLTLQSILDKEINILENNTNTTNWVCLDYAIYFNNTLTIKYPTIDVRWIRYIDMCNNQTICKKYHTTILVAGYSSECMLNSDRYDCINFQN
jgi:hypothetical protein